VNKAFIDAEAIINLAKLKTHMFTLFTGAIKNFYGTIPGLAKSNLHRLAPNPKKFAEFVVDIYEIIKDKVVFNLIDGIIGMDGDGPSTGDVKKFDIVLGSKNAIALDYFASKFMGYNRKNTDYSHCRQNVKGWISMISNYRVILMKILYFRIATFKRLKGKIEF